MVTNRRHIRYIKVRFSTQTCAQSYKTSHTCYAVLFSCNFPQTLPNFEHGGYWIERAKVYSYHITACGMQKKNVQLNTAK